MRRNEPTVVDGLAFPCRVTSPASTATTPISETATVVVRTQLIKSLKHLYGVLIRKTRGMDVQYTEDDCVEQAINTKCSWGTG